MAGNKQELCLTQKVEQSQCLSSGRKSTRLPRPPSRCPWLLQMQRTPLHCTHRGKQNFAEVKKKQRLQRQRHLHHSTAPAVSHCMLTQVVPQLREWAQTGTCWLRPAKPFGKHAVPLPPAHHCQALLHTVLLPTPEAPRDYTSPRERKSLQLWG